MKSPPNSRKEGGPKRYGKFLNFKGKELRLRHIVSARGSLIIRRLLSGPSQTQAQVLQLVLVMDGGFWGTGHF